MSPEFRASGVATQKSDVYAFGVVVLELLSGEAPFKYRSLFSQESILNSNFIHHYTFTFMFFTINNDFFVDFYYKKLHTIHKYILKVYTFPLCIFFKNKRHFLKNISEFNFIVDTYCKRRA